MVYIKSVEWLDEGSLEAKIIISDGVYDIVCFSHPHIYNSEEYTGDLYCLNVGDIVRSETSVPYVENNNGYFENRICAQLVDKEVGRVLVGEICILIEPQYIPKDIGLGEYIEFHVGRIDL